jgi:hypothetical protein
MKKTNVIIDKLNACKDQSKKFKYKLNYKIK